MPELPEVETIARGLEPLLINKTITAVTLRYPGIIKGDAEFFIKGVTNQRIVRVWRRAKLLIIDLADSAHLVFHLKMTGRVWIPPRETIPDKHTHAVFHLDDQTPLFFQDQRKFGYCVVFTSAGLNDWKFYAGLGPEPLELSPDTFADLFRFKQTRIKALLLDQKIIAGVGNIYADESLFMSGIHPETRGNQLSAAELRKLYQNLKKVLIQAIEAGGSSFRDYRDALGYSGMFQEKFLIYGKKGGCCPRCRTTIQTCKVAGRTSSICPNCQKV